jgi:hypothetical protein
LVFLYTALSGWQVKIARDTFNAANRPYLGVDGFSGAHLRKTPEGKLEVAPPSEDTHWLNFEMEIKNFGTAPATNYRYEWHVYVGTKELPGGKIPDTPGTIFPSQTIHMTGQIGGDYYVNVMSGKEKLRITLRMDYKGPSQSYTQCQDFMFTPSNGFMNLGDNCQKPN